ISQLVEAEFDLRPGAFRRYLDLHRPIFRKTAAYGHFGRVDDDFTWERTDRAVSLSDDAGLDAAAPAEGRSRPPLRRRPGSARRRGGSDPSRRLRARRRE